jgi:hypothetical protein
VAEDHQEIWKIVDRPEDVVPTILATPKWDKGLVDAGKLR